MIEVVSEYGDIIAERMKAEHRALAGRWFDRLLALLPVPANEVFPTENLLDHVPVLIMDISTHLRSSDHEAVSADTGVIERARALGALRHGQQASLHQVLREYQVLGGVLVTFVREETDRLGLTPEPFECFELVARLHQAMHVLQQTTVETFVELYTQTISAQAERLEQFTRMATHEWRQPLGTLQFAVTLLRDQKRDPVKTVHTVDVIERSVGNLVALTHKLEAVARVRRDGDTVVNQEVSAVTVAAEAARQLREMADARGVDIRIDDALPSLTVDVGRLELILVNLLSNAIKYSDPSKPTRWVDLSGHRDASGRCIIRVRDNGIGIPADQIGSIFDRFTRGHVSRGDEFIAPGLGLGLSIVDDCLRAIGGEIEVDSAEMIGTTFIITLPAQPSR